MSNLNIPSKQWLEETFEYEYCHECGGDADHHHALPILGNWFARCLYPRGKHETLHPVVYNYRERIGDQEVPF